jgi:hypothetical protein
MSRGKQVFRRNEVTRALRSAEEAGFLVKKLRITKEGDVEVEVGPPTAPAETAAADEWKVA